MIEKLFPGKVPEAIMRKYWAKKGKLDIKNIPPHMLYATIELGVKEYTSDGKNPRITEYFTAAGMPYLDQQTSWCGVFLAYCLQKAGYTFGPQFVRKLANSQTWFGFPERVGPPQVGDVVILTNQQDGRFGHVGLFVQETDRAVLLLGGNQKNEVCYCWYKKNGKILKMTGVRKVR